MDFAGKEKRDRGISSPVSAIIQNLALQFADFWGLFDRFSGYEVESGDRLNP